MAAIFRRVVLVVVVVVILFLGLEQVLYAGQDSRGDDRDVWVPAEGARNVYCEGGHRLRLLLVGDSGKPLDDKPKEITRTRNYAGRTCTAEDIVDRIFAKKKVWHLKRLR